VIFKPLSREASQKIIKLRLDEFKESAMKSSEIELDFTSGVINYLLEVGFDEEYGARPLRRAIEKHIESPLADYILKNNITTGKKINVRCSDRKGIYFEIGM